MALLRAHVDTGSTRLLVQLRSNVIVLQRLAVQAQAVMRNFSWQMLEGAN